MAEPINTSVWRWMTSAPESASSNVTPDGNVEVVAASDYDQLAGAYVGLVERAVRIDAGVVTAKAVLEMMGDQPGVAALKAAFAGME